MCIKNICDWETVNIDAARRVKAVGRRYLRSVQLYGGVRLPEAASANLRNFKKMCLDYREVPTHQVGHDLKHTRLT